MDVEASGRHLVFVFQATVIVRPGDSERRALCVAPCRRAARRLLSGRRFVVVSLVSRDVARVIREPGPRGKTT